MPWRERAKTFLGKGSKRGRDNNVSRSEGISEGSIIADSHISSQNSIEGSHHNKTEDGSQASNKGVNSGPKAEEAGLPNDLHISAPLDIRKQSLWNEAYNCLCKEEPKLLAAYEQDLLSFQSQDKQAKSREPGDEEVIRQANLQNLIDSKLGEIENSPLKICVGQKEIVVKEQSM